MASRTLQKYVEQAQNLISINGFSTDLFKALKEAANTAFVVEQDREYGLTITGYLKEVINNEIKRGTGGGDFWELEKYCFKKGVEYELLNQYYEVLLMEAQNRIFDSYMLFVEKRREPDKRFYAPRRKQFLKINLIQSLQDMIDDKLDILSISLPPGTGKGSHPDDLILTPDGYKRFGDCYIGMEVIAGNGKTSKIIGIYPQGKRDFYKFTFDDGSSCRVSDNHLWKCQTRDDRQQNNVYRVTETSKMLNDFKDECGKRCNYSIDYVPKIEFEDKNLKIEPYLLGVLLGNGHEKFIPKEYLYASYKQRLELLRGLLDTNGFAYETEIEYITASKQLSDDVKELVHSLGGYCSVKEKHGNINEKGEYVKREPSYHLTIQFDAKQPNPFKLSRKANIYKPNAELKRFITNIEYIGKHDCSCIMIEDDCHLYITNDYIITHNTSIEKFFHSAVMGWFPDDYNLFFSHSSDITRMYYDGVLSILQDKIEYAWDEIFPSLYISATNAKMMQINIGPYKPFQNLMTASVGSEMSGKVRANKFLLVDDMIGKIEEALNKNILDKLWNIYTTDARQRKVTGCKEIHIATRWSVHDIIGRLQRAYGKNERCRFIAVPDIDPVTGKSNFDFEFNGFTEQFFHDQEMIMDEISYRCLYKNEPIEREGLLYHEDELRRYIDLPLQEPDAIIGVCDTKSKGTDFLVLPVMYQYGDDFYMEDCICTDSSDYGVQYNRMAYLMTEHNMQQCEFESNAGGDRVAFEVDKLIKELGGRCNITTKPTETNKETRIIVNADWIKKHVLFKDKELYLPKSDYGIFMDWLLCYSVAGKNVHDDIPDTLANFALYVTRKDRVRQTSIISGGLF